MLIRRFLAGLLVSLLAFAPAETIAPLAPPVISVSIAAAAFVPLVPTKAHAATTAQTAAVLSGVQSWSLPGASADLYFALNAGSCAVNRIAKPCTSLISTTRASGEYCQWVDNHFTLAGNNVPCLTDLGVGVWQASTNQALWARDMTNAAWVKVNMTAALTASGIDNGSNNASNLTATAGNATVLQTFTIGSIAETYSVFLERVSGSGNIQITENNGGTWTTADSSICTGQNGAASGLSTAYYVRCKVEATLANPVIGIRIVTSGDVVNADFSQDEEIAFATPPILTTTASAARAADVITLKGAALTAGLTFPQWQYVSFQVGQTNGINAYILSTGDTTTSNRVVTFIAAGGLSPSFRDVSGGVSANPSNTGTVTLNVKNAFARSVSIGTNTDIVSVNGGVPSTSSPAAYPVSPSVIGVGNSAGDAASGAAQLNGFVKRLVIGSGTKSSAQLQALSAQ